MMLQVGDDGVVTSVNEEELVYVDKNELEQLIENYQQLKKEKERLKQTVSDWSGSYDELFEDIKRLEEENEQLKSEIEKLSYANEDLLEEKRIWKQMSDEYTKLSDENEQLRKDATTLIYANQDYRHENEQLKSELESFKPIIFESDGKPVTLYKKGDVE